jgi:beta-1,2-mannobiose phosphorylase / 1,2-beta-oligomannan phosphorylase
LGGERISVYRSSLNPIIRPEQVKPSQSDFEVICVFNAGVARVGEEVILLLRVAERPVNCRSDLCCSPVYNHEAGILTSLEFSRNDPDLDFSDCRVIRTPTGMMYLTSISHLRVARSRDGLHFTIDETPSLFPVNDYEMFGLEDPRITRFGDIYYINYSAVSPRGISTCLASTQDFINFRRHGIIFHPDNKDVAIFPNCMSGKYYALHRPTSANFGKNDIWLAESSNLLYWGNHQYLLGAREGFWDDERVGAGAVPFRIDEGWLAVYHGATRDHRYCLGAILLDPDEPWKVLARSRTPIMEPEMDYEKDGFFGNVIFSCGVLYEDAIVKVYYGAADTHICYAEISIMDIEKTF